METDQPENQKRETQDRVSIFPETWVENAPLLLMLIESGNHQGRSYARDEIMRMAKVADMHVSSTENVETND